MRPAFFAILLSMAGCSPEKANLPYVFPDTPVGEVPQPERNRATRLGVELGETLFFDPQLSVNGNISCASCHHPAKAFSDGIPLTRAGITGKALLRHAPALFNLAWYTGLFWDGGAKNLESQVFGPLTHPDEMGADLKELAKKLQKDHHYPEMFKAIWGTDSITTQRLAHALAQYERSLLSFDSPYDRWKANNDKLKEPELRGYTIYQKFCAHCHTEGLFTDLAYHANGIDTAITDPGFELMHLGRYRITLDSNDIGRYRTPSLRNLGFTGPYMHDGRLKDMDAVLNHYFRDHRNNPMADSVLKLDRYLQISEQQKNDLKAFLKTLNDTAFVQIKP